MNKSKRYSNHHHNSHITNQGLLFLNLPAVRMLKDSLRLFEETLLRNTDVVPQGDFAKETLERLKTKLDDMLQKEEWEKPTEFDYNEVHVLYASIHMHLIDLTYTGQHSRVPGCIQLCKQFSKLVEYAKKQKESKQQTKQEE